MAQQAAEQPALVAAVFLRAENSTTTRQLSKKRQDDEPCRFMETPLPHRIVMVVMVMMMVATRCHNDSPLTTVTVMMVVVMVLGQLHFRIRLGRGLIDSSERGSCVWNGL